MTKFASDCFRFVSENRVMAGFIILGYLGFFLLVCGAMGHAADYPEDAE